MTWIDLENWKADNIITHQKKVPFWEYIFSNQQAHIILSFLLCDSQTDAKRDYSIPLQVGYKIILKKVWNELMGSFKPAFTKLEWEKTYTQRQMTLKDGSCE